MLDEDSGGRKRGQHNVIKAIIAFYNTSDRGTCCQCHCKAYTVSIMAVEVQTSNEIHL